MDNKIIREFIHALRNQLTGILSNIELLTQGYISNLDKETMEILNTTYFNAKYIETLINNVTDIIKINDSTEILTQEINITDMLKQILNDLINISDEANRQIKIKTDKDVLYNIHPNMMQRFFLIIIFELFKLTSDTRKLIISVSGSKNTLQVKMNFTANIENPDYNLENTLKNIFISPENKNNMLNFTYFQKVLTLFNGKITIKTEKNIPILTINFKTK